MLLILIAVRAKNGECSAKFSIEGVVWVAGDAIVFDKFCLIEDIIIDIISKIDV